MAFFRARPTRIATFTEGRGWWFHVLIRDLFKFLLTTGRGIHIFIFYFWVTYYPSFACWRFLSFLPGTDRILPWFGSFFMLVFDLWALIAIILHFLLFFLTLLLVPRTLVFRVISLFSPESTSFCVQFLLISVLRFELAHKMLYLFFIFLEGFVLLYLSLDDGLPILTESLNVELLIQFDLASQLLQFVELLGIFYHSVYNVLQFIVLAEVTSRTYLSSAGGAFLLVNSIVVLNALGAELVEAWPYIYRL